MKHPPFFCAGGGAVFAGVFGLNRVVDVVNVWWLVVERVEKLVSG